MCKLLLLRWKHNWLFQRKPKPTSGWWIRGKFQPLLALYILKFKATFIMENTCPEKEHIPTWAILYPGQTNISWAITLQKLLNCLHEKQKVGSTRRVTCHVNLVKVRLLEHVCVLMAQQRGQPFYPINTQLSRLSSESDLLSGDSFPTYKLDLVCKVCTRLSGLKNVSVFWVLVMFVPRVFVTFSSFFGRKWLKHTSHITDWFHMHSTLLVRIPYCKHAKL